MINTGRPVAVVARELGIQESTLGRWVNLFKGRQDAGDGALSETERAELARLRKENSELKMDRAFLKNSIVGGRLWSREKGCAAGAVGRRLSLGGWSGRDRWVGDWGGCLG